LYYGYVLKNLKDGSYYYGSTKNLEERLKTHNQGKVRYTKGHRPYFIHYFEKFDTREEALRREKFFKSIEGYRWLKDREIT
jgi:putative endonuclease